MGDASDHVEMGGGWLWVGRMATPSHRHDPFAPSRAAARVLALGRENIERETDSKKIHFCPPIAGEEPDLRVTQMVINWRLMCSNSMNQLQICAQMSPVK